VHQVRDARDRECRYGDRLDELGDRRRGRRQELAMVDVVREPNRDAALRRSDERVPHRVADGAREPQVVEGEVEGLVGAAEEVDDRVRYLVGGLAAVGERACLDQVFARSEALYARFFAW
jgi:hypothetical protein